MVDTICRQIETETGGMKIFLEFPCDSEQEEKIKREVKDILFCALQEYWEKTAALEERGVVRSNG